MKYLNKFNESNSMDIIKNDNYNTDYIFYDDNHNKFLVQFKKTKGNTYTMSYFVWDNSIKNWSVSKLINSNPWKIVSTIIGKIVINFLEIKECDKLYFEGLAKENEKEFITQRTKMYLRYLKNNPIPNYNLTNYGNNTITLSKINK
jgi:hypothetical protein